jgi:hypothetical protein
LSKKATEAVTKDSVKKQLISSISLVVGGGNIFPSSVVRNLGVLLNSQFFMEAKINYSCKKAYYNLRRIIRIKRFLSQSAVVQLVRAFVLSQLAYGNALLVGLPAARFAKLQLVQNSAARLICSKSKFANLVVTLAPHPSFSFLPP